MSGQVEIISSDKDIWQAIGDQSLKDDWAVQQAAHSSFVQGPLRIFVRYGYNDSEVKEDVLDGLGRILVNCFEVPEDRVDEVFGKAEYLIHQEMENSGEA
jgi:hypothetical protein